MGSDAAGKSRHFFEKMQVRCKSKIGALEWNRVDFEKNKPEATNFLGLTASGLFLLTVYILPIIFDFAKFLNSFYRNILPGCV